MTNRFTLLMALCLCAVSATAQCWQSLAALEQHSLAIKTDGTLWAWGYNLLGQLGDGTNVGKSNPTKIGTDTNWRSVSTGRNHSLAIKTDGTLWAWGYNYEGELGDGTNAGKSIPTKIGMDTNWQSVSGGGAQSLAIKTDGTLWAWGYNNVGQLGDGTNDSKNIPTKIGVDTNWRSVSTYGAYSLAIKTDGTLWAWGRNVYGQLGDGTSVDKNIPTKIGMDNTWQSVSSGIFHTLGTKTDGTLWAWGENGIGQLGDGSYVDKNIPTRIGTATDWRTAAAGYSHTIAIKTDGTLWAWGSNIVGQLGNGTNDSKTIPTKVGTGTTWQSVSAGYDYALAIESNGNLFAWGENELGQLGDGTKVDKNIPTELACPLQAADACADANDINSLLGGALGEAKTSGLWNNSLYTSKGDPTTGIDCFYQKDGLARTIWYSFTGDGKKYSIRTVKCNSTNYITEGDTQLAIYTGACGSLTPVLCAEDENVAANALNAYTEILTTAGTKYLMLIDGWKTKKGEFCVEVTRLAPSPVSEIGKTDIRLFPNPTTGLVNIGDIHAERVDVFDYTGRIFQQMQQPGSSINLSAAPAGIYFLKIYTEDEAYSARLVKE